MERGTKVDVHDFIDNIKNRKDFIRFISLLREDYEKHNIEWENPNLDRYLEALEASATDIDGASKNLDKTFPKQPSWKLMAELLLMAAYYE